MLIAGGAAGVAGAFNAPLAGVAFAIEELAAAYGQWLAVLVMGGVVAAGLVSQSITGDYIYFGAVRAALAMELALLVAPLAGVVGGVAGGLSSRAFLKLSVWLRGHPRIGESPVLVALECGAGVSMTGSTARADSAPPRRLRGSAGEPLSDRAASLCGGPERDTREASNEDELAQREQHVVHYCTDIIPAEW